MKEHGILMSASSILAYRDGRKTQTRRLAKRWLKVKKGDRFWFRETFAFIWPEWCEDGEVYSDEDEPRGRAIRRDECNIEYRADTDDQYPGNWPDRDTEYYNPDCPKWKPSIHMPRFAARYTPMVTADARLERLWDMTGYDAIAEGVNSFAAYAGLWRSLHTKPGERWQDNPMVVVLQFEGVKG